MADSRLPSYRNQQKIQRHSSSIWLSDLYVKGTAQQFQLVINFQSHRIIIPGVMEGCYHLDMQVALSYLHTTLTDEQPVKDMSRTRQK